MPATMSKEMIDLAIQLRRRLHSEFKVTIKLASPSLLEDLMTYYSRSRDDQTKACIRRVLALAGGDWLARLERSIPGRYYRGQKITSHEDRARPNGPASSADDGEPD